MDFVRSYFDTNEPLTSWTLFSSLFDWFASCCVLTSQKVRKEVFNWSEVHLYRSNFLKNPYSSQYAFLWFSRRFSLIRFMTHMHNAWIALATNLVVHINSLFCLLNCVYSSYPYLNFSEQICDPIQIMTHSVNIL